MPISKIEFVNGKQIPVSECKFGNENLTDFYVEMVVLFLEENREKAFTINELESALETSTFIEGNVDIPIVRTLCLCFALVKLEKDGRIENKRIDPEGVSYFVYK
jgi:hypothetical protein